MSEPEIRIDQLTGLRTILAPGRADRPDAFVPVPRPPADPDSCPFCEGREDRTPAELTADRPGGGPPDTPGWLTRTVPNLYPALGVDGSTVAAPHDSGLASPADPLRTSARASEVDLFSGRPAGGSHEVIVHSPAHASSLAELGAAQLEAALRAWRDRMRVHADVPCRHLIVNEGPDAGASLEHTHAQLYALPFVPAAIARERERFGAYNERTMGGDLLLDVASEEVRRRERLVAIDDEALLVCPWASRSPYELRIIPRRTAPAFEEDEKTGTAMIATAFRALARRFDGPPQLNLWVRTAPSGAGVFHWHVDVVPRLTAQAGFELGTGVDLNIYPPERAAADLRDCL